MPSIICLLLGFLFATNSYCTVLYTIYDTEESLKRTSYGEELLPLHKKFFLDIADEKNADMLSALVEKSFLDLTQCLREEKAQVMLLTETGTLKGVAWFLKEKENDYVDIRLTSMTDHDLYPQAMENIFRIYPEIKSLRFTLPPYLVEYFYSFLGSVWEETGPFKINTLDPDLSKGLDLQYFQIKRK